MQGNTSTFPLKIKPLSNMQESLCFSTSNKPGSKNESGLFDVTMGAYDGAEVCELVGIFILYQLSRVYQIYQISFRLLKNCSMENFVQELNNIAFPNYETFSDQS